MDRVEKILFAWLVAMLVGVAAAAGYVVIDHATRCSRFHFDGAKWRSHPQADRTEAAERLLECHRLDGLSRAEVLARLGKPQSRFTFKHRRFLSYDIGTGDGLFGAAFFTLDVELSARHVVRRASIESAND